VACEEEKTNTYRVLWGNLKESSHLTDVDLDGRIILK
jgi:hypothetical protein